MQKNFRKWAIGIFVFLLCFSLAVNIQCVLLLFRYRQIYQAPPVWVTDTGALVVPDSGTLALTQEDTTESVPSGEIASELTEADSAKLTDVDKQDVQSEASAVMTGATMYITNSGTKFHREGCSSLAKSKIPITYEDAVSRGFSPCGRCNPS